MTLSKTQTECTCYHFALSKAVVGLLKIEREFGGGTTLLSTLDDIVLGLTSHG